MLAHHLPTFRPATTRTLNQIVIYKRAQVTMTSAAPESTNTTTSDKKEQKNDGKREIKLLMLHGYTQSGPLFHAKTRALEKLLQKHLAPLNLTPNLLYPTAPNQLKPQDIPGYSPATTDDEHGTESDSWAWYRKDEASGSYRLLHEGMYSLATVIRSAGGVDGVVGFSQGGSLAALLASAMEVPHRTVPANSPGYDWTWVEEVRAANSGMPLKFAVIYSGFFGPPEQLKWLYEPHVKTPTLQFIGSLDTVVDEGRSRGLVARCQDPVVIVHPGGHYVPVSKEWAMPLMGFVKKCCEDDAQESESGSE